MPKTPDAEEPGTPANAGAAPAIVAKGEPADGATKESDGVSSLIGIVPEVFYDVLARVLPGALFLIGMERGTPRLKVGDLTSSSWQFLVLSFVCGFFLNAGGVLWVIPTAVAIKFRMAWLDRLIGIAEIRKQHPSLFSIGVALGTRLDEVNECNPRAGRLLIKVLAEADLTHGVLTGFLLLAIIGAWTGCNWLIPPAFCHYWLLNASICTVLLSLSVYRQISYLARLSNFYEWSKQKNLSLEEHRRQARHI